MFELNLIKDKIIIIEKRKHYFNYFKIIYGVFFLIFILCLGKSTANYYKIKSCNHTLAAVKHDIEEYKTKLKIFDLEKEWAGYYESLTAIEKMINNKTTWAPRLQELSVLFPPGIFLNNLSWTKDAGSISLEVAAAPNEPNEEAFKLVDTIINDIAKDRFFAKNVKLETQKRIKINNAKEETEVFEISVPCTGAMQ